MRIERLFEEIELRTSTPSGPGGRHASRTASRVEAVYLIAPSEALSRSERETLLRIFGETVTAVAQDTRSQAQNRRLAIGRILERVERALEERPIRRPTKPTRRSGVKRLDRKRRAAVVKKLRRPPWRDE